MRSPFTTPRLRTLAVVLAGFYPALITGLYAAENNPTAELPAKEPTELLPVIELPDPRIIELLRKAALNDTAAILEMRHELGITNNPSDYAFDESGKWAKAVAEESNRQNPVAWFLQGVWQPTNPKAVQRMEDAARKGQAEACEALANKLLQNRILSLNVEKTHKEAFRLYYLAAKGGRSSAAYSIGSILEATNPATAFTWYLSATKAGNPKATGKCAWLLNNGIGTAKNPIIARKFGERATKQGDPMGAFTYAMALLDNSGTNPAKDKQKARRILQKLAENDIIPAAYWLGLCIIQDPALEKQKNIGIEWLHYAADKGYVPATKILNNLK